MLEVRASARWHASWPACLVASSTVSPLATLSAVSKQIATSWALAGILPSASITTVRAGTVNRRIANAPMFQGSAILALSKQRLPLCQRLVGRKAAISITSSKIAARTFLPFSAEASVGSPKLPLGE